MTTLQYVAYYLVLYVLHRIATFQETTVLASAIIIYVMHHRLLNLSYCREFMQPQRKTGGPGGACDMPR